MWKLVENLNKGQNKTWWMIVREYLRGRCADCGKEAPLEVGHTPMWAVHHKDGDATNHRIGNLTLLCSSCHSKRHQKMRQETINHIKQTPIMLELPEADLESFDATWKKYFPSRAETIRFLISFFLKGSLEMDAVLRQLHQSNEEHFVSPEEVRARAIARERQKPELSQNNSGDRWAEVTEVIRQLTEGDKERVREGREQELEALSIAHFQT